jgi:hypothetical protein
MARVRYQRPEPPRREPAVQYDPWIERLAWLMDSSIGIGRWRIGVDGLLGLAPGLGDAVSALISMLIVWRAVRAGAPRVAVARMVANIAADTLLGAVPVAGDFFDMAYKANMKNLRIYQETLVSGAAANTRHWLFFAVLAIVFLAVLAAPAAVVILAFRAR